MSFVLWDVVDWKMTWVPSAEGVRQISDVFVYKPRCINLAFWKTMYEN